MIQERIDPRMIDAGAQAIEEWALNVAHTDGIAESVLTAALRAAREAGADAVTVDGGLVKWVEDEPSSVMGKIGEVLATGGLSLIGQTNRAWRLVPLDGGDDG